MKVSSKYQVTIPKKIRERMGLRRGQEVQFICKGGLIILVPDRPISAMRGFVRESAQPDLEKRRTAFEIVLDSSGWLEFFGQCSAPS